MNSLNNKINKKNSLPKLSIISNKSDLSNSKQLEQESPIATENFTEKFIINNLFKIDSSNVIKEEKEDTIELNTKPKLLINAKKNLNSISIQNKSDVKNIDYNSLSNDGKKLYKKLEFLKNAKLARENKKLLYIEENIKNSKLKMNKDSLDNKNLTESNNKNNQAQFKYSGIERIREIIINQKIEIPSFAKDLNDYCDLVSNILEIRLSMKADFALLIQKKSKKQQFNIKETIVHKWSKIIHLLLDYDVRKSLDCLRLLGELYIEFEDYEHAKRILFLVRYICINLELPFELAASYESLAYLFKSCCLYEKSIKFYKKLIEICWIIGDYITELRCYDNIGLQYFYLCDKTKAKYYHNRMINGKIERNTKLKQKVKKKFMENYERIFWIEENNVIFDVPYVKEKTTLKTEDMPIHNDKLKEKLYQVLLWFDTDKVSKRLEDIDIPKAAYKLNDSAISECDVTFLIVNDDQELKDTKM